MTASGRGTQGRGARCSRVRRLDRTWCSIAPRAGGCFPTVSLERQAIQVDTIRRKMPLTVVTMLQTHDAGCAKARTRTYSAVLARW